MTIKKERSLRARHYRKDFGLSWGDSFKAAKCRKPLSYQNNLIYVRSFWYDLMHYEIYTNPRGVEFTFYSGTGEEC